jgi:hypothetical protein
MGQRYRWTLYHLYTNNRASLLTPNGVVGNVIKRPRGNGNCHTQTPSPADLRRDQKNFFLAIAAAAGNHHILTRSGPSPTSLRGLVQSGMGKKNYLNHV